MPLAASVPLQLPEALQLAALADVQLIVVELPTATDAAARLSVGAAGIPGVVAIKVAVPAVDAPTEFAQLSV